MRLQIRSIPPLSSDLCSLRLWLWSLLPVLRESFGWAPRKRQLKIPGEAAKVVRYLDVVSILLRSTLTIQQPKRKEYRNAKNTHSLGATPRNGRVPKPSLNAFRPTATPRKWSGRDHSTRMDAAGRHHRREEQEISPRRTWLRYLHAQLHPP